MIFNQANSEYLNVGTIDDGAIIAAAGVRLINSDSGRLYGGVTFTVGGSTLVNQLGGVIRLTATDQSFPAPRLVIGSTGADTVVNAGLIAGSVALGDGADIYIERSGLVQGVDLGAGDDVYRVEMTQTLSLNAAGGAGRDRVVLAGTGGQYWGDKLTGFEELSIEAGGNFVNFSGFQSITLAAPLVPGEYWPFANLIDSLNPTIDVALAGQNLMLHRSSLHSITGSDLGEQVDLGLGSAISGAISLGGGDDLIRFNSHVSAEVPGMPGSANGGGGSDTLVLNYFSPATRSYDFASFQGFEKLAINPGHSGIAASTANVANLSGLIDIDIGSNVTLVLGNSVSPDARVGSGFGGGLTLEAGSVIGRYGFPDGSWDQRLDIAQGDPLLSTTIVNRGTILGEVRFYIGDDLYDGRAGSVGATVYGNAGNDRLLGGSGAETLIGGFGADTLAGNGGADLLSGGAGHDLIDGGEGSDVLLGGLGADRMSGGSGNDIYEVDDPGDRVVEQAGEGIADNVFAYVDFTLPVGTEHLLMNYGVQTYGYGNGGDNIIVGNARANVIEGRAGYDTLTGGGGSDLFIINPGFGVDVITDFTAGAGTPDALIFSRALFTSFAAVMANSAQVGTDTWIGDGLGNTIVLVGVAQGDLHADDFGFF